MATLKEHFDSYSQALISTYGAQYSGQSFTASASYSMTGTRIWADRQGSGSYTFTVELYLADGSHFPTGSVLASATQDIVDWAGGAGEEHIFTFTTPYTLTKGLEYVIVGKCPDAPVDNRTRIHGDTAGYADGIAMYSNNSGGSWVDYSDYDVYFQNYGDYVGVPTSITKSLIYNILNSEKAITKSLKYEVCAGVIDGNVKIGLTNVVGATLRLFNQSCTSYIDSCFSDSSGNFSFLNLINSSKYHIFVEFKDTAGTYGAVNQLYNSKSLWEIEPV